VDGGAPPGELVELGKFLPGGGKADLQALGLAEPAFALGFVDAGQQVGAQAGQPGPLSPVRPQERTPDVLCSSMQTVPQARPQPPSATLRRAK
jgi:hypothetical protein